MNALAFLPLVAIGVLIVYGALRFDRRPPGC